MKKLIVDQKSLIKETRWDYDYHEPAELLEKFPVSVLKQIRDVAQVIRAKKDPTKEPEASFQYIDIASIDIETGEIARIQELTGSEAPSRARKLVQAYDIIISTCRPTRKAIAVVPEELHGQICSTGFSVIRANSGVNPLYLHFALRLESTIEQFRKFSTGSSYPAILDNDVEKTLIPVPEIDIQNDIVKRIKISLFERTRIINEANKQWENIVLTTVNELSSLSFNFTNMNEDCASLIWDNKQIDARLKMFPILSIPQEVVTDQSMIEFD